MVRVALLAAIAWAACLAFDDGAVDAAVWRVPLHQADATHALASLQDTRASVWEPVFPAARHAAAASPVPVDFHQGIYATVHFGSPPQPMAVVVALESPGAVVLNHAVGAHSFYDHAKSSTYVRNGTRVHHAAFDIDGFASRDRVSVGPSGDAGVAARDVLFVEVDGSDDFFRKLGADIGGFVGLGVGRDRVTGEPSLVRKMINQGLLDRPELGVRFGADDGHIVFGGIDATYDRRDFHFFDATALGPWMVPLRGVTVDGKQLVRDAGNVQIGFWPFVLGPKDAVDAIARAVGAKDGTVPCEGDGPDVVLAIGDGLEVRVAKKDYTIQVRQGVCEFMFVAMGGDVWMLSLPFLQSVYMTIDYGHTEGSERFGLAPIKPREA